jgi:predicted nucleotidyltransferase
MSAQVPPVSDLPAVRAAILEGVASEPSVKAAYLFGSVARGVAGPLSDVDVALLLEGDDSEGIVARVTDNLARRLHTSRVDVVSLSTATIPLRYHVVRDGTLVLSRDPARLERFIATAVLEYLDLEPLRNRALQQVRSAIVRGR